MFNENKILASYMEGGASIELIKKSVCYVGGVKCNS